MAHLIVDKEFAGVLSVVLLMLIQAHVHRKEGEQLLPFHGEIYKVQVFQGLFNLLNLLAVFDLKVFEESDCIYHVFDPGEAVLIWSRIIFRSLLLGILAPCLNMTKVPSSVILIMLSIAGLKS